MKPLIALLAAMVLSTAAAADTPNFSDARWQTVPLTMFQGGLKVDRLTGEAWYMEKTGQKSHWVTIPGPLTKAGKKTMSYGENYEVQSSGPNVYLIGLRGGDSWRLADNRGKPYWRKIQ